MVDTTRRRQASVTFTSMVSRHLGPNTWYQVNWVLLHRIIKSSSPDVSGGKSIGFVSGKSSKTNPIKPTWSLPVEMKAYQNRMFRPQYDQYFLVMNESIQTVYNFEIMFEFWVMAMCCGCEKVWPRSVHLLSCRIVPDLCYLFICALNNFAKFCFVLYVVSYLTVRYLRIIYIWNHSFIPVAPVNLVLGGTVLTMHFSSYYAVLCCNQILYKMVLDRKKSTTLCLLSDHSRQSSLPILDPPWSNRRN